MELVIKDCYFELAKMDTLERSLSPCHRIYAQVCTDKANLFLEILSPFNLRVVVQNTSTVGGIKYSLFSIDICRNVELDLFLSNLKRLCKEKGISIVGT